MRAWGEGRGDQELVGNKVETALKACFPTAHSGLPHRPEGFALASSLHACILKRSGGGGMGGRRGRCLLCHLCVTQAMEENQRLRVCKAVLAQLHAWDSSLAESEVSSSRLGSE